MAHDKLAGMLHKAIKWMASMTLLVFLSLLMFYLFPRLSICLIAILSIPFILRLHPKTEQTG